MDQKTPAAEMPVLNFIRDVPSPNDAFGSHSRLANAVATAIHTQKDLKVIGLLGAWGSGKSTVVKLAQAELEKAEGVETHVFTYDAWLHQSDPPRRSFLETLIKFLLSRNTGLSHDKWQARLDELNRRVEESDTTSTPTLTGTGQAALFLLLLLPFGMQFVSHDWIKDIFTTGAETYVYFAVIGGTIILLLPVLFALLLYLCWRPSRNPFAWRWPPFSQTFWSSQNWFSHKPPHEHDSILSLVMNKEVNRVRNKITRSPDPTAIEFQNAFREIMKEVSKDGRRFIFVIDNLDRLPEAQAVGMWGTIRSFFLGATDTEENGKQSYLPTVILPVDETAIARMYADKTVQIEDVMAGGADLARSFMEKTFDLTFRVTRPVLSDWKGYLEDKMKQVFGKYLQDDWSYLVGLFIEKSIAGIQNAQITPRIINTHINRVGTLWLQWREEDVTFASIAYYAIFFGDRDPDIRQQVTLPQANIALLDSNWRRAIAAIYYGCKPATAMQVLIEQPLRTAIEENKHEEFQAITTFPGFEPVLQRVLDQATNGDIADPVFVLNGAALFDALNPPNQSWTRYVWQTLRQGFQNEISWQKLRDDDAISFAILMVHCDVHQGKDMLTSLALKLAAIEEATTTQPDFAKRFSGICLSASEAATKAKLELPDIVVPGKQALFLNILSACANDEKLAAALKTKASNEDIVTELSNNLSDPATALQVEGKVRALINRKPSIPWNGFINAAAQIIQDQDVNFAGMNPAVECLGLLRKSVKEAAPRIKALLDSGTLVTRMHQAHTQKQIEIESRLLALLLLTSQTFDPPAGQAWQGLLGDRPELPGMTDKALQEFDEPDNLGALVEHSKTNAGAHALIGAIVSLRMREGRIGSLNIDEVIAQLPEYLNCIENDLHDPFIREMADYDTFWEQIDAATLDANVIRILGELTKSGSSHEVKAREALEKKLKAVTAGGWASALDTGQDPLIIAMSLSSATSKTFHLGTVLYGALETAIVPLLANDNGDFRKRWFNALDLVSPSSRVTLLKTVRDRITTGMPVARIPALLREGGNALLTDGAFSEEADGAVRYVVWPLLGNADGMTWLVDSAASLQRWIGSDKDTRNVTIERLSAQWQTADDAGKAQLTKLAKAWGLPDLPIEDNNQKSDRIETEGQ